MHDKNLDFASNLAAQIAERAGKLRKGDRTRDLLKLTTARLLESTSYNNLRLSDVTDSAGVSKGTLYLYFQDKPDLTSVVLQDFMSFLLEHLTATPQRDDPFAAITETNKLFLRLARANKGMFSCIFQISEQEPKFNVVRQKFGHDWYKIVSRGLAKRMHGVEANGAVVTLTSYCLGLMMDEVVRRAIVVEDASFNACIAASAPNEDDFAEFLSLIWYRSIYGEDPKALKSDAAMALHNMKLATHQ